MKLFSTELWNKNFCLDVNRDFVLVPDQMAKLSNIKMQGHSSHYSFFMDFLRNPVHTRLLSEVLLRN